MLATSNQVMAAHVVKRCGTGVAGLLLVLSAGPNVRPGGHMWMSAKVNAATGMVPPIDQEVHPRTERAVFALG